MPDTNSVAPDPFEKATVAAAADIRAALAATPAVDAGAGDTMSHGRIRHRSRQPAAVAPEPDADPLAGLSATIAQTAPDPEAARTDGPVGHGTIRLRGLTAAP